MEDEDIKKILIYYAEGKISLVTAVKRLKWINNKRLKILVDKLIELMNQLEDSN